MPDNRLGVHKDRSSIVAVRRVVFSSLGLERLSWSINPYSCQVLRELGLALLLGLDEAEEKAKSDEGACWKLFIGIAGPWLSCGPAAAMPGCAKTAWFGAPTVGNRLATASIR